MARSAATKLKADTLRMIGEEVYATEGGKPVTNEEQLHRLLWRQALGYKEQTRDVHGSAHEIVWPPDKTIQKLLLEQLSGKPATVQVEEHKGLTAAEKVSELARNRVNDLIKPQ
jgi:hypothetical protein